MMNCVAKFITSSDEIWIYQVILSEKYTVNLHDIITFKFSSITFRQQMKNFNLYLHACKCCEKLELESCFFSAL